MPPSPMVPGTSRWPEVLSVPGSPSFLWKGGRWQGSVCRKGGDFVMVAFGSSGHPTAVAYPRVGLVTFRLG